MNYKKDIIVKHKNEYILVKNNYTGLYDLYLRVLLDNDKPRINEMIKEYEEDLKNEISIDEDFLKSLIESIERAIILIKDNKHIEDTSGFYNGELILYELNDSLKYLRGK